jgi:hypothetical protein
MKKAAIFVTLVFVFISLVGCANKKTENTSASVPEEISGAACGRVKVGYGDDIDRMGDELIASAKILFSAEVSGREKLPNHYKVKFYINEEPYKPKRPLYKEPGVNLSDGMEVGYKALLPVYIVPGEYDIRYELYSKKDLVCSSETINFTAK